MQKDINTILADMDLESVVEEVEEKEGESYSYDLEKELWTNDLLEVKMWTEGGYDYGYESW